MKSCTICGASMADEAVLCMACGFDAQAGRRVGHGPLPAGLTPPPVDVPPHGFAQLLDDDEQQPAARDIEPRTWRNFWLPAMAATLGLLSLILFGLINVRIPALTVGGRVVLQWFFNTVLLGACLYFASHQGLIEFGPVHRGILKCSAIVLLTMGIGVWLPLHLHVVTAFVVPVVLMRQLFELDLYEAAVAVGIQFLTYAGVLFAMRALL